MMSTLPLQSGAVRLMLVRDKTTGAIVDADVFFDGDAAVNARAALAAGLDGEFRDYPRPSACPVCNDTGIVQCAETNPEDGVYEQACPEKVHEGQPCPVCNGKGWTEAPGCNCGTPLWSLSSHEPYCGMEPCPRGCPVPPSVAAEGA